MPPKPPAFSGAATRGDDLIINCTEGVYSIAALEWRDGENLAGKILVDVANPLDFSQGTPPRLAFCNESLGRADPERLSREPASSRR